MRSVYFQKKTFKDIPTLGKVHGEIAERQRHYLEQAKLLLDHALVTIFNVALELSAARSPPIEKATGDFDRQRNKREKGIDKQIKRWTIGQIGTKRNYFDVNPTLQPPE